jgi:hypothetical protein
LRKSQKITKKSQVFYHQAALIAALMMMTSGDVPDSTTSRSSHSASGHSDAALGGRIELGKGFLWICLGEHKKTHTYNYIYILYNVYMYIFPVDSIVLLDFSMQRIQNMFSKSSGNQD